MPYGYPVMTIAAMIPPLWKRVMNPKVRAWRKQFYPRDCRLEALRRRSKSGCRQLIQHDAAEVGNSVRINGVQMRDLAAAKQTN